MGLYLEHSGDNSRLDGAGVYACPYDLSVGLKFFYENAFGLYSYAIGLNLVNCLQQDALPGLIQYCSKEEADRLTRSFKSNWTGLR